MEGAVGIDDHEGGETQTVEDAMQYLQTVENELSENDFAEFLSIIEDFKSNKYVPLRCRRPALAFLRECLL